jgi:hypothetical protein
VASNGHDVGNIVVLGNPGDLDLYKYSGGGQISLVERGDKFADSDDFKCLGIECFDWRDVTTADLDGDGLKDGEEVYIYGTDPLKQDTDGDGYSDAYEIAKGELKGGNQAYIIYPVIEESYALDMAGAKKMYGQLKVGEFKEFRVGLIHGRLKQKEQDQIMLKFKNKELDILVSTTVLEVGIDIPNATCMIVEHAQRFGLAQLHQLRGRVGRGVAESFCILISDAESQEAKARIDAMVKYNDGFRIAEEDLKIRGPGEFFGERQHGLAELKIANPLTQMQLLKKAREEAIKLTNIDPRLETRQNVLLKEKLLQRFPEYEKLMVVG